MGEHTPGPWTYSDQRMTYRDEWDRESQRDDRGFWVEAEGSAFVAQTLKEADARLIAAAPDLLAALEWAMTWVDREVIGSDQRAEVTAGLHDVRVAIAKAKGSENAAP